MGSIAIMCSGGDSSGMNPAIKKFVEYALDKNLTPYFIFDGLEGLIDGDIRKADYKDVTGIIHLGGTMIRTSRSKRFYEFSNREIAYRNLQKNSIDKLIVLGGDGSFKAMDIFSKEFNISFIGIPSTIDNNINGTDYCLGVDTALNVIRTALDEIRDTALSFKRAFVVETMGADCGYLALISALTSGAEICIIPEIRYDLEALQKKISEEMKEGRTNILAVVAEGTNDTDKIKEWIERDLKLEVRELILGHIQRGGSPSVYDRLMAFEFISYAIDRLMQDSVNEIIVYRDAKFEFLEVNEVVKDRHRINDKLLDLVVRLSK
ncbi:6-phosphofructokinase [Sulfurovum sp. bin170]|uniref:6-phosphofructokinase n=1 Tax=Sulfurovum sp. bin170 TaxID=2695268 RepID=UPI0013DEBABF|nr:6-phosphofructokinase [Sulfurovum sp. bin170]NEW60000.1 6-phosphofructokinase [Sulfurovum sp. bin170]